MGFSKQMKQMKQNKTIREQQQWEFDIDRYYRYKRYYDLYKTPIWLEMMQEVEDKYPNRKECFE